MSDAPTLVPVEPRFDARDFEHANSDTTWNADMCAPDNVTLINWHFLFKRVLQFSP